LLQTTGFQPFSLSVGGEVRRKLLNPPAFSWWSFSFQTERCDDMLTEKAYFLE
jgi:hypothetical protein